MNPVLGDSKFSHVAKVTNTTYRNPAATASTTIDFTGVAAGTTSVKIGDVVYYVIVTEDGAECTHKTTVVLDAKDATCTEPGSTGEAVCVDCGAVVQEAQEIAAKGHTFGEWVTVKEPTTKEEGSKERICSVCQTKETGTIAKLPDTEDPDQPTTPSAPENVKDGEVTKDSIKITWDAPASTDKNQNSTVNNANKAAKTGDTANVVFPAAVMMLAGAAVAGILFRRKWMK